MLRLTQYMVEIKHSTYVFSKDEGSTLSRQKNFQDGQWRGPMDFAICCLDSFFHFPISSHFKGARDSTEYIYTTQGFGEKMPSSLSSVLWNGRLLDELGSTGKKFGCFWLVVPSKELAPSWVHYSKIKTHHHRHHHRHHHHHHSHHHWWAMGKGHLDIVEFVTSNSLRTYSTKTWKDLGKIPMENPSHWVPTLWAA